MQAPEEDGVTGRQSGRVLFGLDALPENGCAVGMGHWILCFRATLAMLCGEL